MKNIYTYQFPFASYPAVRLAVLLAGGILLDFHFQISTAFWGILLGLTATCYVLAETFLIRVIRSKLYFTAILAYVGMIFTFGGFWHSLFDNREPPYQVEMVNSYRWEELVFSGEIYQISKSSTGNIQVDITIDSTSFPNSINWDGTYNLRAVLNPNEIEPPENLAPGHRITFEGPVYPLEEIRNPSQFDYKHLLASKDIYVQAGVTKIIAVESPVNRFSWIAIRNQVIQRIDNNFSPETAHLAKALLIGYKNELQPEEKLNFSRTGLSHIMAVSGLHVGFILAPFWIIIPFFWSYRYGKQVGLALLIGLLIFYAGLTGFSASVMRASLVGGFLAYGKLFHKVRDSKNLTAAAAIIILIAEPSSLFSIGFQLSFSAVFIILMTLPPLTRLLPTWVQFRWYSIPIMVVIVSLVVQTGLFPLLTYYFGEFSIIGPLANALVVPLLGIAVPYALFLLLFSEWIPQITVFLTTPADYLLQGILKFVNITAQLPGSWITFQLENLFIFALWMIATALLASYHIPALRWKLIIAFLLVLCFQQIDKLAVNLKAPVLTLTIFDVGQGDAALVSTPNNKHFLVDAGRWQPGYNSAKQVIIPHLKANGIHKLDAIFLSHPHADHIGGILHLINEIPVDTIYNSGTTYSSNLYRDYITLAKQKGIPVIALSRGTKLVIDPAIRLFAYGPLPSSNYSNVNNSSLVFELIYGETEFLFMGDAERDQEIQITSAYPELINTNFLKVSHHGSKTSSTNYLLQAATPEISSVSLGLQNRFQHPHPSAIRRLQNYSNRLLFTSLEGAVILESDGRKIRRRQWR